MAGEGRAAGGLILAAAAVVALAVVPRAGWRDLGQAGVRRVLERELSLTAPTEAPTQPPAEWTAQPPTQAPTQAPAQPPTEPPTQPPAELPGRPELTHLLEAPEEEPTQGAIAPLSVDPGALELRNDTAVAVELGDYLARKPGVELSGQGPQILILHTHTTEAYTMADGDNYTPSDQARTTDGAYNMIRVGEEMRAVFEEMGLQVIHDCTLYDYPGYNGSYARSLAGIQGWLEQYPTISVVLDVHRDALTAADGSAVACTAVVEGEETAQVMLVVGTDDGGLEHPNWRDNLALAARIQARMLMRDPGLPRPVNLRSQRFNQHMTPGSLLVEVGTSGNTLRQALAGARLFARAAGDALLTVNRE